MQACCLNSLESQPEDSIVRCAMAVPMHGSPQGQAEDPSRVCWVYDSVVPEPRRCKIWPSLLIIPAWVKFSQVARATLPIRTLLDGRLAGAVRLKDWLAAQSPESTGLPSSLSPGCNLLFKCLTLTTFPLLRLSHPLLLLHLFGSTAQSQTSACRSAMPVAHTL